VDQVDAGGEGALAAEVFWVGHSEVREAVPIDVSSGGDRRSKTVMSIGAVRIHCNICKDRKFWNSFLYHANCFCIKTFRIDRLFCVFIFQRIFDGRKKCNTANAEAINFFTFFYNKIG